MSLPRYSEYKDSGVAWLAEIPAQWELKRLGYFFDERREKVSDKDFPALSVTKNGIVPQLETAAKTDDGDNRKKVCSGDFVINSRSDRKGSSGISSLDGSVSLINTVLRPRAEVVPGYVHQLLRSQSFQEEFYRFGKGIVADLWSTNYSEMSNITLALPSRQEQTAIAAFLDRETAKIDGLIAEQEKLITLLAEKRQATISHAVTKGLNPDAPMKDSGAEWLGAVPEGWECFPVKRLFRMVVEPAPDGNDEELLSIYTDIGVRPRKSLEAKGNKATTTDGYWRVKKGDIIVNKLLAWMGAIGLSDYDGVTSPAYDILRGVKPLHPKFFDYLFRCGIMFTEFRRYSRGIMDMRLRLYFEELGQIIAPFPSLAEQAEIIKFLDQEAARADALSAAATHSIGLLKERRAALISAAVTGKIDVRAADGQ